MILHSIINRICGMMAMLGFPCLIIGIILIARNKSKTTKTRGIILVCLIPASTIIRFISSIAFRIIGNTGTKDYKNLQGVGEIQPVAESSRAIPSNNTY